MLVCENSVQNKKLMINGFFVEFLLFLTMAALSYEELT